MCSCLLRYAEHIDAMMHEAFRLNIKYSLLAISVAINGSAKLSPRSLFLVKVELSNNKVCWILSAAMKHMLAYLIIVMVKRSGTQHPIIYLQPVFSPAYCLF